MNYRMSPALPIALPKPAEPDSGTRHHDSACRGPDFRCHRIACGRSSAGRTATCLFLAVWVCLVRSSLADPPFRYPEGEFGPAQLKYIQGLPVLEVRGAPAEIGAQVAHLALKPAARILDYPQDFLKQAHMQIAWPLLDAACQGLGKNIPPNYLEELHSLARESGQPRDLLVVANTMLDILGGLGCSTLIVSADRSVTGQPMFGRNLDFPTLGYLNDYSLVTIYHPHGKRSFVAVTFPGCLGVVSGMNSAGLTVAVLEVYESRDHSLQFDPQGTPYALCFRRLLEECETVEQAEQALRGMKRTNWLNLAICDAHRGAVFEITPKTVAVRSKSDGCLACTNHFRTPELRQSTSCWRYPLLEGNGERGPLGLREIQQRLHATNQGELTFQTMIFEPASLTLHLAIGIPPTSALPLKTIELADKLRETPGQAPSMVPTAGR